MCEVVGGVLVEGVTAGQSVSRSVKARLLKCAGLSREALCLLKE